MHLGNLNDVLIMPAGRRCFSASHVPRSVLPFALHSLRQSLTDVNSEVVQQELRSASGASKAAQTALVKADFEAFASQLELDQVTFRAVDARAKMAEETQNHKAAALLEQVHHRSWAAAESFAQSRFPVFFGKTDCLAADLPAQMACWASTTSAGKHGVAKILWVNFSVLGVVSAAKLDWVANHVSRELHSQACTSVAIIIQSNRSYDEQRPGSKVEEEADDEHADAKSENSSSESGAEDQSVPCDGKHPTEQGSARMGRAKSLRAWRYKIEEVFCEPGRGLTVDNANIVFDPATVWGSRHGSHNMLMVLPKGVPPSLMSRSRWCSVSAVR